MNPHAILAIGFFIFVVILIPASIGAGWWPILAAFLWLLVIILYVAKRRRDQHKNRKDIHQ